MARYYLTATRILNDVAIDVGLDAATDPVASTEKQFVQLKRQLDIAIEELSEVHTWEQFKREYTVTTDDATYPDGEYPLPTDFHYMIDQTQWDRTNNLPMEGPVSSQQWAYLQGRDLGSSTIYASFRQAEGLLKLWPAPPADGIVVAFEYASTNWIRNAADTAYLKTVALANDTILLPPSLVRAYLKSKFLGAKGFQSVNAEEAVSLFLGSSAGKDAGAPKLSLSRRRTGAPLMNGLRNVMDTGYGN